MLVDDFGDDRKVALGLVAPNFEREECLEMLAGDLPWWRCGAGEQALRGFGENLRTTGSPAIQTAMGDERLDEVLRRCGQHLARAQARDRPSALHSAVARPRVYAKAAGTCSVPLGPAVERAEVPVMPVKRAASNRERSCPFHA